MGGREISYYVVLFTFVAFLCFWAKLFRSAYFAFEITSADFLHHALNSATAYNFSFGDTQSLVDELINSVT